MIKNEYNGVNFLILTFSFGSVSFSFDSGFWTS